VTPDVTVYDASTFDKVVCIPGPPGDVSIGEPVMLLPGNRVVTIGGGELDPFARLGVWQARLAFSPGEKVQAKHSGSGRYAPATFVGAKGNTSYQVRFDDKSLNEDGGDVVGIDNVQKFDFKEPANRLSGSICVIA
jgi:hypothetical protein